MALLPGRCMNTLFCTEASAGHILRVAPEARFVCPQCGKGLVPHTMKLRQRAPFRSRGSSRIASILTGTVGFACGVFLGALLFRGESMSAPARRPITTIAAVQPVAAPVAPPVQVAAAPPVAPPPVVKHDPPRKAGHRVRHAS